MRATILFAGLALVPGVASGQMVDPVDVFGPAAEGPFYDWNIPPLVGSDPADALWRDGLTEFVIGSAHVALEEADLSPLDLLLNPQDDDNPVIGLVPTETDKVIDYVAFDPEDANGMEWDDWMKKLWGEWKKDKDIDLELGHCLDFLKLQLHENPLPVLIGAGAIIGAGAPVLMDEDDIDLLKVKVFKKEFGDNVVVRVDVDGSYHIEKNYILGKIMAHGLYKVGDTEVFKIELAYTPVLDFNGGDSHIFDPDDQILWLEVTLEY